MVDPRRVREFLEQEQAWIHRKARELSPNGEDPRDLAQEGCQRFLQNPPPVWDNPHGWMYSIMRGAVSDQRRHAAVRRRKEEDLVKVHRRREIVLDRPPCETVCRKEAMSSLDDAVEQLPQSQRSIVRSVSKGRPRHQLTCELGMSLSAVNGQFRRAKHRLREVLSARGVDLSSLTALLMAARWWWLGLAILVTTSIAVDSGFVAPSDSIPGLDARARLVEPESRQPAVEPSLLRKDGPRQRIAWPVLPPAEPEPVVSFRNAHGRSRVPCARSLELLGDGFEAPHDQRRLPPELELSWRDQEKIASVSLSQSGSWSRHWDEHRRSEALQPREGWLEIRDAHGNGMRVPLRNLSPGAVRAVIARFDLSAAAWPIDPAVGAHISTRRTSEKPDRTGAGGDPSTGDTAPYGYLRMQVGKPEDYPLQSQLRFAPVHAFIVRDVGPFAKIRRALPIYRRARIDETGQIELGILSPGDYRVYLAFEGRMANLSARVHVRAGRMNEFRVERAPAVTVDLVPDWGLDRTQYVEVWKLDPRMGDGVQFLFEDESLAKREESFYPGHESRSYLIRRLAMHPHLGPQSLELLAGGYLVIVRGQGHLYFRAEGDYQEVLLNKSLDRP